MEKSTQSRVEWPDAPGIEVTVSEVQNTQYCVRVNGFITRWFDVISGVKQGCLLSPLLFNLYIEDLVTKIKALNCGVNLLDKQLSVMLYADDIVLISETEKGLQSMLNTLNDWCINNSMSVNLEKSKIVHFRKGPKTP